jgi:murein DD-endopeptidase MepM/ murein hydrolase activator NlpD
MEQSLASSNEVSQFSNEIALKIWAKNKQSTDWYFYLAGIGIVLTTVISVTLSKTVYPIKVKPVGLFSNSANVAVLSNPFKADPDVYKENTNSKLLRFQSLNRHLELPEPSLISSRFNESDVSTNLLDSFSPTRITKIADFNSLINNRPNGIGEKKITYRVQPGDNLAKIWSELGAKDTAALKLAAVLESNKLKLPPNELKLKAGEKIELIVAKDTSSDYFLVKSFTKKLSEGRKLVVSSVAENYEPKIISPIVETRTRLVHGVIRTTLASAARDNNIPFEVVDNIVDLFGDRLGFSSDLQPGDTFIVKFEERFTKDGEFLGMGPLSAASIMSRKKHFATVRYEDKNGKEYFFDESGNLVGNYFLKYPVKFSRISAVFSDSRLHPVLKYRRPHYGVDFAAPTGTPVRTVGDGVVLKAGYFGGAGNMVKIKHNGKYSTAYLHLSKIERSLRPGTIVKRGQIIGAVGTTGLSTGPHLHFSLYENGVYIDPLKAKLQVATNVAMKEDIKLIKLTVLELAKLHKNYSTTLALKDSLKNYRANDLAA